MCITLCSNCSSSASSTLFHIFVHCPRIEAIWSPLAEWLSERLHKWVTLSPRFTLLGVPDNGAEYWLVKESWWRALRAWVLYETWVAWTAGTFGGRQFKLDETIAFAAWAKMVHALQACWQTKRVNPIKGPPKLPSEWQMLGLVEDS